MKSCIYSQKSYTSSLISHCKYLQKSSINSQKSSISSLNSQCVLQCVAVCCSVLQCVAVCCSVLQCVVMLISAYTPLCNESMRCIARSNTTRARALSYMLRSVFASNNISTATYGLPPFVSVLMSFFETRPKNSLTHTRTHSLSLSFSE